MKEPRNVSEVRFFLGMTDHLGKFMPHVAEKTHPLRELTKKSNMWVCGPQQQLAFDSIKEDLTTIPGLALYDPNADTSLQIPHLMGWALFSSSEVKWPN